MAAVHVAVGTDVTAFYPRGQKAGDRPRATAVIRELRVKTKAARWNVGAKSAWAGQCPHRETTRATIVNRRGRSHQSVDVCNPVQSQGRTWSTRGGTHYDWPRRV